MVVKMKVAAANRAAGDLYNSIPRMLNRRIRHILHPDILFPIPTQCSHFIPFLPNWYRGRLPGRHDHARTSWPSARLETSSQLTRWAVVKHFDYVSAQKTSCEPFPCL